MFKLGLQVFLGDKTPETQVFFAKSIEIIFPKIHNSVLIVQI